MTSGAIAQEEPVFDFDRYRLMPARRLLLADGEPVPLGGRAFDILMVLVEAQPDAVGKDELIRRVWGGQLIEENTLAVHIWALRKALGDGKDGNRYIRTVPGRGYQFQAAIEPAPQQPAAGEATRQGDLPRFEGPLVGREAALAEVAAALDANTLVTITGPGGIGKTRLARAVGAQLMPAYPDGVSWVDLAPVADPSLILGTVARAIGVPIGDGPALPRVLASLKGRRHLLILDNCEHVAGGVAELAVALRALSGVRLLATSLAPLDLTGEQIERLEPLAVPAADAATVEEALRAPSVQLFVARARAAAGAFELDRQNLTAVVGLCRRLEGVPLALELVAVRAALLGADEVADRIDACLLELSSGRRDVLPKHQTLRALMQWSHALLSEAERIVLRRLAGCAGGCTLEAAEAVVADEILPEWEAAEHLTSLIAKSLVVVERTAQGARFRLLETPRSYARERLVEAGEFAAVMNRLALYLHDLFTRADIALEHMPSGKWAAQWAVELDNLRAALDWCFEVAEAVPLGVALTAASTELWTKLGDEGRARIGAAFARLDGSTPAGIRSTLWLGKHADGVVRADVDAMLHASAQALSCARLSDDPVKIIRAAFAAVYSMNYNRDWLATDKLLSEIKELSSVHGFSKNLARAEAAASVYLAEEGRIGEAMSALDRAEHYNRAVEDEGLQAYIYGRYVVLHVITGNFAAAVTVNRDSVALSTRLNDIDMADKIRQYLPILLLMNNDLAGACEIISPDMEQFHLTSNDIVHLIRAMIFHFVVGNDADAARIHGYIGKGWPRLTHIRSLVGVVFERVGQALRDRVGDQRLDTLTADGEALSIEQIEILAAEGLRDFTAHMAAAPPGDSRTANLLAD